MSHVARLRQAKVDAKAEATGAALPQPERFSRPRVAELSMKVETKSRFEGREFGKSPVPNSADLERILALPRRPVPDEDSPEAARMVAEMTARLSNGVPSAWRQDYDRLIESGVLPADANREIRARIQAGETRAGCLCHKINPQWEGPADCIVELRFIQAWYLFEAAEVGGAVGMIAVGGGKTALDVLTAMVVPNCEAAALLLPAGLYAQFMADFRLWAQHFKVPNIAGGKKPAVGAGPNGEFIPADRNPDGTLSPRPILHVLKYSELSRPNFSKWFEARPEISVVIADEMHSLSDRSAVTTKRFIAHFTGHPEARFFGHTGSLTSEGIDDYSHLAGLALDEGSPVPIEPHVVRQWGNALNPQREGLSAPPGALLRLCEPNERVEHGYQRRLLETRGIVSTSEGSLFGIPLIFGVREPPPMPPEVREKLAMVRVDKIRPDGEELQDALEIAAVARHVACGFYMYWNYPGATELDFAEGGRIDQWFAKRQAYFREVRKKLEREHIPGMDSPKLLKDAAVRYWEGYKGKNPVWASQHWPAWHEVEDTVPHETRTHWISDWLARDAAAWMLEQEAKGTPGLCWVQNPEMGELIARIAHRPYYGAGDKAALAIRAEQGDRSVVASIPAHHKGRNLQRFSANLIVQPPGSAKIWEQLLGRTHRSLQKALRVTVEVYQHVPELASSFETAMGRAEYVNSTLGMDQKLLSSVSGT